MSRPEVVGIGLARETDTDGMSTRRLAAVSTALVVTALVLPACTSTTSGQPIVSVTERTVASTIPTTPQVDEYADLTATVQEAMTDVSRFWASEGAVVPVRALVTTDPSTAPCAASRDAEKERQAVAWACDMVSPQTVVVNPENLSAKVADQFGDIGTYIVIAHEQGHIGLPLLNPATDTDSDVEERRADCASGAYFKWVVAGQSPSVSVTEAQAGGTATAMWRDTPERTKAFADGITYGLPRCLA